jgi:hypothetical protein
MNRISKLRKKHEKAWKVYSCALMSDGWTNTSHHQLINFLSNNPTRTYFLGSMDASNEVANALALAYLL